MPNPKDVAAKAMSRIHQLTFDLTGGRLAGKAYGMPVVKLTTTGRKSGKPRTTMLTSPVRRGDAVVLIASYGGDDRDPSWYLNLRDNPDVKVTMLGRSQSMTARVASPDEKADLWPDVTAAWRGYAAYQKRTDRDIPVVILEPRRDT